MEDTKQGTSQLEGVKAGDMEQSRWAKLRNSSTSKRWAPLEERYCSVEASEHQVRVDTEHRKTGQERYLEIYPPPLVHHDLCSLGNTESHPQARIF